MDVKEMKISIFCKLIAWFKKIFHIHQNKGCEAEQKVDIEKMIKKESHEEKQIMINGVKKDMLHTKPTEPPEAKETAGGKLNTYSPRQKEIDLGEKEQAKQIKRTGTPETILQEKKEKLTEYSVRVMRPFVELDLNETKVFIIIPKQSLRSENIYERQLKYKIKLNDGEVKELSAEVINRGEYLEITEKRIELEKPLRNLEIIFPSELGNKIYRYKHQNDFIYVFVALGNNLGRMHHLYDINGNINSLPQREVWILLKEGLELGIESDVIEDKWIWENYQPFCVDLKNVSKLPIKDINTNKEEIIPCESTFSIEGDVICDDFGEQFPIFTESNIEIKAPRVNEKGWKVWIQNKQAGYKVVSDNWLGKEPLKLRISHDLPCECGEFQVDICEQNGESVTTLFFRYIPSLRLNYPRKLIIPDSKKGHGIEKIEVSLLNPENWEIEMSKQVRFTSHSYEIELPSEIDTLRFSISKKGRPETKTNFEVTIPRLKWKTLRQENWTDKPLHLKREELISGEDFYLYINANSFIKYDILVMLEANNQKLQESKFDRRGKIYNLLLNQFYDTIKENKNEIVLKIKILEGEKVIGENISIMHFPKTLMPEPIPQKLNVHMKPVVKGGRGMRKGKGFSRGEILQAGLKTEDIKRLKIPFDRRRKSIHRQNVDILKSLIGGDKYADRSN